MFRTRNLEGNSNSPSRVASGPLVHFLTIVLGHLHQVWSVFGYRVVKGGRGEKLKGKICLAFIPTGCSLTSPSALLLGMVIVKYPRRLLGRDLVHSRAAEAVEITTAMDHQLGASGEAPRDLETLESGG
jgi:hypothetical protein